MPRSHPDYYGPQAIVLVHVHLPTVLYLCALCSDDVAYQTDVGRIAWPPPGCFQKSIIVWWEMVFFSPAPPTTTTSNQRLRL